MRGRNSNLLSFLYSPNPPAYHIHHAHSRTVMASSQQITPVQVVSVINPQRGPPMSHTRLRARALFFRNTEQTDSQADSVILISINRKRLRASVQATSADRVSRASEHPRNSSAGHVSLSSTAILEATPSLSHAPRINTYSPPHCTFVPAATHAAVPNPIRQNLSAA